MKLTTLDEVLESLAAMEAEKLTLFNATSDILQQQKDIKDEIEAFRQRIRLEKNNFTESDKGKVMFLVHVMLV